MRVQRLIREDILDLMRVKVLSYLELLSSALPTKVGSPLSIKSLQEDIDPSVHTIESWISLFDWSVIEEEGIRFENCVASHLLKYCQYDEDVLGEKMEEFYLLQGL